MVALVTFTMESCVTSGRRNSEQNDVASNMIVSGLLVHFVSIGLLQTQSSGGLFKGSGTGSSCCLLRRSIRMSYML